MPSTLHVTAAGTRTGAPAAASSRTSGKTISRQVALHEVGRGLAQNLVSCQPVGQARFGDPEVFGDLLQRGLAAAGDGDDVVTEPTGVGLGHGDPSRRGRSLTGEVSTRPWADTLR